MSEQRLSLGEVRHDPPDPLCDCHTCQSARTIAACGDVLDRLGHEYRKAHNSEPHPYGWTAGYLHALDVAEQWLKEALQIKDA